MDMIKPDWPDKALSIRQPWTWCVLHAGKPFENRSWPTRFRGRFCIHAAKGMTREEYSECYMFASEVMFKTGKNPVRTFPSFDELQRGGIVGIATIMDCVSASDDPWFTGPYGFKIVTAHPVPFLPVKGALGFFDWRQRVLT